MHDGPDGPAKSCALCGEEVYLGDMVQCRECKRWYCDECQPKPEARNHCDDCGDTVCKIGECFE